MLSRDIPHSYAKEGFHPDGFIHGGETVRIPDSLEKGNRAGFFWDFQPPAGVDVIQVFASTDLETAKTIREWIRRIPGIATRGAKGTSTEAANKNFIQLQDELTRRVTTRGVRVVADEPHSDDASETSLQEQIREADWNSVSLRIHVEESR